MKITKITTIVKSMIVLTGIALTAGCGGKGGGVVAPLTADGRNTEKQAVVAGVVNVPSMSAMLAEIQGDIARIPDAEFKAGGEGRKSLVEGFEEAGKRLLKPDPNFAQIAIMISNEMIKKVDGCGGIASGVSDPSDKLVNCPVQVPVYNKLVGLVKAINCGGISSVSVSTTAPQPIEMKTGDTALFSATGQYADASCGTIDLTASAAWTSSNPAVAAFDAATIGQVRGGVDGETTISATAYTVASANTITVTVKNCDKVKFADPGLEAAIRNDPAYTGKATGDICKEHVAQIRVITLDGVMTTGNLSGIENLTGATTMYLQRNNIASIAPLAGMTGLRKLNLNNNMISDVSPLAGLTGLVDLSMNQNAIVNIAPLASLVNLLSLKLTNNMISDITAIGSMTRLHVLSLETNAIVSIASLSSMTKLEELYLDQNKVVSLAPLSRVYTLRVLSFSSNQVADISPLKALLNLTTLSFPGNRVAEISWVSTLTGLTQFNAEKNKIVSLAGLSGLSALEVVTLNNNLIIDLTPIANLSNIKRLALQGNKIARVDALVNNQGVSAGDVVFLGSNPLQSIALNTQIPTLRGRGVTVNL